MGYDEDLGEYMGTSQDMGSHILDMYIPDMQLSSDEYKMIAVAVDTIYIDVFLIALDIFRPRNVNVLDEFSHIVNYT